MSRIAVSGYVGGCALAPLFLACVVSATMASSETSSSLANTTTSAQHPCALVVEELGGHPPGSSACPEAAVPNGGYESIMLKKAEARVVWGEFCQQTRCSGHSRSQARLM